MQAPVSATELAALLPDPLLLLTRDGRVVDVNPAAVAWLGVRREALVGARLHDLVASPGDAVERYLALCTRSRQMLPGSLVWRVAGATEEVRCDGGVVRPGNGGSPTIVLLRCRPKDESVSRFVALNEQITALSREIAARRRAEAELRAQREWFRVTLSSIGDAVIATDREGRITFMNGVGERLTGWSGCEAIGRPLDEVFRIINEETRQRVQSPVEEVSRRGAVVGLANHTILIGRDGTERPIEDSAAPIRDARGNVCGVVLVFHDITERRRAELAREQLLLREQTARAEAEAAARAREAFLARASHELRTPLTSALGTVRLLKWVVAGRLKEAPESLIDIASRNLDAMLQLVNDLLDASKLASGRQELALEPVGVAGLVEGALEVVRPQARDKGVALRASIPAGLAVPGDPLKLEQVLVNLLANAVKFTPAGGEVTVEARAAADEVVILVRDTGEGIEREHLKAIFEPFVQVGQPRRVRGARGTGLGLAICRQIVTLHGGRIWAESEGRGRGSTFVVSLPRIKAGRRAS